MQKKTFWVGETRYRVQNGFDLLDCLMRSRGRKAIAEIYQKVDRDTVRILARVTPGNLDELDEACGRAWTKGVFS